MMERIAAATIIRGYGECHEYINGVKNDAIEQMNARHRQEIDVLRGRLSAAEAHRNGLLEKRLRCILRTRKSLLKRMADKLAIAWAVLYWYLREAWRKLLANGTLWGLWVYKSEESE